MSRLMLVEPSLEYREDAINYVRESLESDGHCMVLVDYIDI